MGLVKHNNNSISAVTSMASLSTGSMTLIKEVTASSDASISFVDGSSDVVLDSTYPIYKIEWNAVHPSSDNQDFKMQVSTNTGSSYGVTATTTYFYSYHSEDDANAGLTYQSGGDLAQSTSFQRIGKCGADNDQCIVGNMFLFNPSSTTFVKHFIVNAVEDHGDNWIHDIYVAGYFNTTSAVDAIQFKFNSGNIDAGTIKLYGIKDS